MGLVERPGSIESGDVPRYSYIRRNPPVSELSIFIDEAGISGHMIFTHLITLLEIIRTHLMLMSFEFALPSGKKDTI